MVLSGIEHITSGLTKPRLAYSPAVRAGPFVFVSGQASVDSNGNIVHDTFEREMRRAMGNVLKILKAAGLGFQHVVSVKSYVAKQKDLKPYNELYREYFKEPFPARTTIVNCLGTVVKFEIDVVAYDAGGSKPRNGMRVMRKPKR
jgi:2-iminobutanoate/2-iminopropanoate deaminase